MSTRDKHAVNAVHHLLMECFPKAFPKDYDRIVPLKVGIQADLLERLPEVDPTLLRRALANHTSRAGYLLALVHHHGDWRYNLEGQPISVVTPEERAEDLKRMELPTKRAQIQAERIKTHHAQEQKRRQQREIERKNREAKAERRAAEQRRQQENAAHKAALEAQGIKVESRSERKRRLIREAAEQGTHPQARAQRRSSGKPTPVVRPLSSDPHDQAMPSPTPTFPTHADLAPSPRSTPATPTFAVTFKKKRRIINPEDR